MSPEDIIQAYDDVIIPIIQNILPPALIVFSCRSRPNSPACMTPSKLTNPNGDKEWDTGSNGTSPAPEYTGEFFPPLTCRKVLRFVRCTQANSGFSVQVPNFSKSPASNPTNSSSTTLSLAAASPGKSTKLRKTRSLRYFAVIPFVR